MFLCISSDGIREHISLVQQELHLVRMMRGEIEDVRGCVSPDTKPVCVQILRDLDTMEMYLHSKIIALEDTLYRLEKTVRKNERNIDELRMNTQRLLS